jgi:hypothetical protein
MTVKLVRNITNSSIQTSNGRIVAPNATIGFPDDDPNSAAPYFLNPAMWQLVAAEPPAPRNVVGRTQYGADLAVSFDSISNGGAAITGFTATSNPGGHTATGASSPLSVTGLTDGTAYTFTVIATNSVGNSPASAASPSVTAESTFVPDAPTLGAVAAEDGLDGSAAYVAPEVDGGASITTYTVTATPVAVPVVVTGTANPLVVTGLVEGSKYTLTVHATNSVGNSAESAPSDPIVAVATV